MSTKTNVKKLEEEIEYVKELVNNLTIDMDDHDYAIYKLTEWDEKLDIFECLMYKMKPVNKTALNHELDQLYELTQLDSTDENINYNEFFANIPEYQILKNLPIETKKRIYKNDPEYLIFKFDPRLYNDFILTNTPIYDWYIPYNKAAKEYVRKYGVYSFRKRCEKSNALRGLKPDDDWDEDFYRIKK